MKIAAWVAVNRVVGEKHPNSFSEAVVDRNDGGAFCVYSPEKVETKINDPVYGDHERGQWEDAQRIAAEVITAYRNRGSSADITNGALYFANIRRTSESEDDDTCYLEYKSLLENAGITDFQAEKGGVLQQTLSSWLFYNSTGSAGVPSRLNPNPKNHQGISCAESE